MPCKELVEQVARAMGALLTFLSRWQDAESDSSALLRAMGVCDSAFTEQTSMRFVRRQCLGFSVGLYRRFVVRLRSFPYRLWIVADGTFRENLCQSTAEAFFREPPCCVGFFGQRLRQLCPDVKALLGPLGRTTIATWLRTLVWSIYQCEKEHTSCRRLLLGAGPSRSWTLCARGRLLECSRVVHLERTRHEPTGGPIAERATVAQRLAAVVRNTEEQNPLQAIVNRAPAELDCRIADVGVASGMTAALAVASGAGQDGKTKRRSQTTDTMLFWRAHWWQWLCLGCARWPGERRRAAPIGEQETSKPKPRLKYPWTTCLSLFCCFSGGGGGGGRPHDVHMRRPRGTRNHPALDVFSVPGGPAE